VFNLKHVNGKADCSGPAVQLGAEEKYFPTCYPCYRKSLVDAGQHMDESSRLEVLTLKAKMAGLLSATDDELNVSVSTDADTSYSSSSTASMSADDSLADDVGPLSP